VQSPLLYLAFLLSGGAGLIYQVVWVRHFGNIFGNTLYSASLVLAVFMLGLGFGSYVAGRWIDTRGDEDASLPVRAYAYAEALIGLGALGLAFLLPNLRALAAHTSWYVVGPHGWHEPSVATYGVRYLVAALLLLPITLLMGATLTLLIRHIVSHHLDEAGWRIGLLYGVNTGGAALGAFATDFVLVPVLGLLGTVGIGVVLNLGATVIGLRLAEQVGPAKAGEDAVQQETTVSSRAAALTAATIFLSGFAAMGVELVWFRFFNVSFGGYRSVFSLLLTVLLIAMWAGSVAGGALHRRFGKPGLLYLLAQSGMVVSTVVLLVLYDAEGGSFPGLLAAHGDTFRELGTGARRLFVTFWQLKAIAFVIALPGFFMGSAYPLANALVQDVDASIGRTAGRLYLANTAGAVLGSLVAGFWLIPHLGTRGATTLLLFVAVLSGVTVVLASAEAVRLRLTLASAGLGAALVAIGFWAFGVDEQLLLREILSDVPKNAKVLTISEGIYETIAVTEDEHGSRDLKTNGHTMSATSPTAQRYMRLFSHFPLLHLEEPESALVICFGVGNTTHAASLHPSIQRLEVVDLSEHVLKHASYFERWNRGVIEDPRLQVYVQDGRSHLQLTEPERYDLITLEPPPIAFAGVSALYSKEFYELSRSRLKKGGFMTQWLPAYQVPAETQKAAARAFLEAFPGAVMLSGHRTELILVGRRDAPIEMDLDTLTRRIAARPDVQRDLGEIHVGTLTDFVGLFIADAAVLDEATKDSLPLTDDYPIMEYTERSHAPDEAVPLSFFAPFSARTWCPSCWSEKGPDPRIRNINDYMHVMAALYEQPFFRQTTPARLVDQNPNTGKLRLPPGITLQSDVFRESAWLRQTLLAKPPKP
jgi:spermidine synthase